MWLGRMGPALLTHGEAWVGGLGASAALPAAHDLRTEERGSSNGLWGSCPLPVLPWAEVPGWVICLPGHGLGMAWGGRWGQQGTTATRQWIAASEQAQPFLRLSLLGLGCSTLCAGLPRWCGNP